MSKHTLIPWEVVRMENGDINVSTFASDGVSDICYMNKGLEHDANANLIVKAVNCHKELLDVCKTVNDLIEDGQETSSNIQLLLELVIAKDEGRS